MLHLIHAWIVELYLCICATGLCSICWSVLLTEHLLVINSGSHSTHTHSWRGFPLLSFFTFYNFSAQDSYTLFMGRNPKFIFFLFSYICTTQFYLNWSIMKFLPLSTFLFSMYLLLERLSFRKSFKHLLRSVIYYNAISWSSFLLWSSWTFSLSIHCSCMCCVSSSFPLFTSKPLLPNWSCLQETLTQMETTD